jgi:hypothetical protein
MPGGVVGPGDEDDLLVAAGHGLHLSLKWSPRRAHQQQPVLGLDGLQSLGKLLLETLRIRLEYQVKGMSLNGHRMNRYYDALQSTYIEMKSCKLWPSVGPAGKRPGVQFPDW